MAEIRAWWAAAFLSTTSATRSWVAGAFVVPRFLTSMLFGVGVYDPVTFVGVAALLIAVALMAAYVPARRAMRVDPIVALRYE